jgi:hypothetical protein
VVLLSYLYSSRVKVATVPTALSQELMEVLVEAEAAAEVLGLFGIMT